MRVTTDSSQLGGEFPTITHAGESTPNERRDGSRRDPSYASEGPVTKSKLSLPHLGKTPRSGLTSPSASPSASPTEPFPSPRPSKSPTSPPGLKDSDEQDRHPGDAKEMTPASRLLIQDVIFKGETCSVLVCGTELKIRSPDGDLASIPVQGIVARFEQEMRQVVCLLLDWELFMVASVSEVERKWRLEMGWQQAITFRKHIEKLGIVQTDISSQFKFRKHIGNGAFSEVYLAQHLETKATVAAKIMKKPLGYPDVDVDPSVWQEFTKEVSVLAMTQGHENILRFHGTYVIRTNVEEGVGPCSLAMLTEHLDVSLLDLVRKHGRLPEASTRGVAESLLRAVAHLNSVGLAHRDIKVSNVMLRSRERGDIVLIDYGFGRQARGPEVFRNIVGTVGYLAPELFLEDTPVDLRYADVFSIGIVALTCLTGRSVFQGKSGKGGASRKEGSSDRAKYYENKECFLDWTGPETALTPLGLEAMQGLLEKNPSRRPLAADALESPWYALPFDDCVAGSQPEAAERELASLTSPRCRRKEIRGDGDGRGEGARALKPTPPQTSAERRRPTPPVPGRQVTTGSSSSAIVAAGAA